MRSNEIKADGKTEYAVERKYGTNYRVVVLAKGLPRVVFSGWNSVLSEQKDGVLVQLVEGDRITGDSRGVNTAAPVSKDELDKMEPQRRRSLHARYESLPSNMAIVRSSKIVGEWDEYITAREEARERFRKIDEARRSAEQQREAKLAAVRDLLGVGEYDVQYRSSSLSYTISSAALDALLEKLS